MSNFVQIVTALPIFVFQLIFTTAIGVSLVLVFYSVVADGMDEKVALISTILLVTSFSFIRMGYVLRTSTMAVIFLIMSVFASLKLHKEDHDRIPWLLITLVSLLSLYFTHVVVSVNIIMIGLLAIISILLLNWFGGRHVDLRGALILIAGIIFFSVSIFIINTFQGLVYSISDVVLVAISLALRPEELVSSYSSGSGSNPATGSGAGLIVLTTLWISRMIFLVSSIILTLEIIRQLRQKKLPTLDLFLLVGCGMFLLGSLLMLVAGETRRINPGRIYRYFTYFSSVVVAKSFVQCAHKSSWVMSNGRYAMSVLVILVVIGSVSANPTWTIDTGLREGGELPYTDYTAKDIALAKFLEEFGDDNLLYADRWNWQLHRAYGKKDPIQYQYVKPDSETVQSSSLLYFDDRYNGRQYLVFSFYLIARSDKIYDNGALAHRRASKDIFVNGISHKG
jgi:hypothetical protein